MRYCGQTSCAVKGGGRGAVVMGVCGGGEGELAAGNSGLRHAAHPDYITCPRAIHTYVTSVHNMKFHVVSSLYKIIAIMFSHLVVCVCHNLIPTTRSHHRHLSTTAACGSLAPSVPH